MDWPCKRGIIPRVVALVLLLVPLSAVLLRAQERVLPFDPLTPREREAAITAALADARVRAVAVQRPDVSAVNLVLVKADASGERVIRQVEVLFGSTGREPAGMRVLVEPERGVREVSRVGATESVVAGTRVQGGSRTPISPAEVERARALVLRSANARTLLGADPQAFTLEFLPLRSADPRDPCFTARCLEFFFRRGDTYLTSSAIVQLGTGAVELRRREP
ncbi:MAG TPA: hypothetical protein VF263_03120 [Longimicrobiaceae bacterium]